MEKLQTGGKDHDRCQKTTRENTI
ncbi:uncharacterized protein G2W53_037450 [Senna tora]|uniref:Uncharacterized protein n=1 Tax=Senna tora TaxID=362788 RepID=A0A834SZ61_9FABA|nr:uncharacterized protein G2W53_037450 [Senna tora]